MWGGWEGWRLARSSGGRLGQLFFQQERRMSRALNLQTGSYSFSLSTDFEILDLKSKVFTVTRPEARSCVFCCRWSIYQTHLFIYYIDILLLYTHDLHMTILKWIGAGNKQNPLWNACKNHSTKITKPETYLVRNLLVTKPLVKKT